MPFLSDFFWEGRRTAIPNAKLQLFFSQIKGVFSIPVCSVGALFALRNYRQIHQCSIMPLYPNSAQLLHGKKPVCIFLRSVFFLVVAHNFFLLNVPKTYTPHFTIGILFYFRQRPSATRGPRKMTTSGTLGPNPGPTRPVGSPIGTIGRGPMPMPMPTGATPTGTAPSRR